MVIFLQQGILKDDLRVHLTNLRSIFFQNFFSTNRTRLVAAYYRLIHTDGQIQYLKNYFCYSTS